MAHRGASARGPVARWLAALVAGVALAGCRQPAPLTAEPLPDKINESYREIDEEKDVEAFVDRFEAESREIYQKRAEIAALVGLKPGDDVADVGAGTGVFTGLFSEAVGPSGIVYAVDIVPLFLERVSALAAERGWSNVKTVLCTEQSVELPARSVDVVFLCDTYHHFAYPMASLASIHRALRQDGELFLVDFERIEGKSRPFVLEHVRCGKETVLVELAAAGFELVEEHDLLEENYCVRLRKR